ncbi:MAG: lysophospholipid acyltransferase family protein [Gammaproteobacteria bacterium]
MVLLRSLLFYAGLVLATLVFAPLSLILLAVPFRLRFRIMSQWSVFNLWWLGVTCGLRHDVTGIENIPDGPCIIMCKHQSAWETLALQLIFPAQVWVLKKELLWIPIYGWALATMEPIAIDRASGMRALRQIVDKGKPRLDKGLCVVIFPEGTRTAPGQRRKYQPGGGMLASQSGYPVVPVAHNSGCFWPRHSLKKWPGTIRMVIGPPVDPKGRTAAQITREVEDWIETTVASLPVPVHNQPADN